MTFASYTHSIFKLSTFKLYAAAILTVSAFAVASSSASAHDDDHEGPKAGDIKQTHALNDFSAIDVRGVYRLNIVAGEDYKVFTSGQPKEVEHMRVYVKNGVLVLDQDKDDKRKGKSDDGVWVDIALPNLSALTISGVGTGDVTGVKADNFDMDVSGVGELEISGTCGRLETSMRGVGEIDARGLECEHAVVSLKGVGEVSLFASESVDVTAKGIGAVNVYGKPKDVKQSKGFMSGVTVH